jgi:hypothetical protein
MKDIAPRRRPPLPAWLAVVALLALLPARAEAQVSPLWDHYKVYDVLPPFPYPVPGPPVTLIDQFLPWTHQVLALERFANPTDKQHLPGGITFPVNEPDLHYAWWAISPQPFNALVTVTNQFGDFQLDVRDARYLLNPALKNQHGSPPLRNHYKCYDCQGPPVNLPVMMNDQFGPWQATVAFPRFFCNPVEKRIGPPGAEIVHPILDNKQHYTCYIFTPPDPGVYPVVVTDQFVNDLQVTLGYAHLICVPTDKTGVTSASTGTWGRLKLLYR